MICTMKPGSEHALDDAKEVSAAAVEVSGGKKRPVLVDMAKLKSVSREAQEYHSADEAVPDCSAVALIVGSPVSRVIASFFLRFRSVKYPIKLFTSEGDAIEWLKGFLK